ATPTRDTTTRSSSTTAAPYSRIRQLLADARLGDRQARPDRIGIAWLRHTCGTCRFCRRGDENLCVTPAFTGWDADGGYAALVRCTEKVHEQVYRACKHPTRRPVHPLMSCYEPATCGFAGAPPGIRTQNLRIKSPLIDVSPGAAR